GVRGGLTEQEPDLVGVTEEVGGHVLLGGLVLDAGVVADHRYAAFVCQSQGRDRCGVRDRGQNQCVDVGRGGDVDEGAFLGGVTAGVEFKKLQFASGVLGVVLHAFADSRVEALRVHVDDAVTAVLREPGAASGQYQQAQGGGEGGEHASRTARRSFAHGGPP